MADDDSQELEIQADPLAPKRENLMQEQAPQLGQQPAAPLTVQPDTQLVPKVVGKPQAPAVAKKNLSYSEYIQNQINNDSSHQQELDTLIADTQKKQSEYEEKIQANLDARSNIHSDSDVAASRQAYLDSMDNYTKLAKSYERPPLVTKEEFSTIMPMFALLAAMGTKKGPNHGLTALKAFTGAMKGYQEGKLTLAKKQMDDFDKNIELAKAQTDIAGKQADMILNDKMLPLDDKLKSLQWIYGVTSKDLNTYMSLRNSSQVHMDSMLTNLENHKETIQARMDAAAEKKAQKKEEEQYNFTNWTQEQKEGSYQKYLIGGKTALPQFSSRDVTGKAAFEKGFNEWKNDHGITPGKEKQVQIAIEGESKSLIKQISGRNAVASFIDNLDEQKEKVREITTDMTRVGVKFLDVPLRDLRKRVKGDPNENILDMYATEMASEQGKLTGGGVQSIATLPVDMQQHWQGIFDPSLTPRKLLKVMEAGSQAGNVRLKSLDDQITNSQSKLENYGSSLWGGKQQTPEALNPKKEKKNLSSAVTYLKGAKTRDEAVSRMRELQNPNLKWTRDELEEASEQAGW